MNQAYNVVLMLFMYLLVTASSAQQMKHAPTVEQCRADQRLWLDELENSPEILPDYTTLTGWIREMFECKSVDPENRPRYYNVLGEIDAEKVIRLEKFLDRHGLYDKFIEEDRVRKPEGQ